MISTNAGPALHVKKGPTESQHSHTPNREKVTALKLTQLQLGFYEKTNMYLSSTVLTELPDRRNLRKMVQREHLKDLPPGPPCVEELGRISDKFLWLENLF